MKGNLAAGLPADAADEITERLLSRRAFRLERIVSRGHRSPDNFWYDQEEDEWVLVVQGAARLRLAEPDEIVEMQAGDYLLLPAGRRHRVEWTSDEQPTIWLALFSAADQG